MDRREFLAFGTITVVGLSGCASSESENRDTKTHTTPMTETMYKQSTSTYSSLQVSIEAVQPALVDMGSSPSAAQVPEDNRQYVLVHVASNSESPSRDAFSFRFDGDSYQPIDFSRDLYQSDQYTAERGEGRLYFSLPSTGDATDAKVVWSGGSARPDDNQRMMLSTPAQPLSPTLKLPEKVLDGEELTLTVEVQNEGSSPGRFVAGLNVSGVVDGVAPSARISVRVPPDETITQQITRDLENVRSKEDDSAQELTYTLVWGGGEQSQTVRLN